MAPTCADAIATTVCVPRVAIDTWRRRAHLRGSRDQQPPPSSGARAAPPAMGKKQHSKDQLYITQTEWKKDWGGKKEGGHLPYKVRDAHVPCGCRA